MSGDAEQDHFCDGLVEDIITTLSKLAGLRVIARNSSFVYKGRSVDVREAAKQLGVRYVLEGSVRKSGNRIRITAQLIDAKDGTHLWAERYDRAIDDIFAIQDEITLVLGDRNAGQADRGRTGSATLHDNNQCRGLDLLGAGPVRTSDQALKQRTELAQRVLVGKRLSLSILHSAALNAMLGFAHYADARYALRDNRETALAKARAYVERSLELDRENSDAYTTSSLVFLLQGRHDEEAVRDAHKAIELAPGSADAAAFASFVFASSGYLDEAKSQIEKAMTLNPNYPPYYLGHLGNACAPVRKNRGGDCCSEGL